MNLYDFIILGYNNYKTSHVCISVTVVFIFLKKLSHLSGLYILQYELYQVIVTSLFRYSLKSSLSVSLPKLNRIFLNIETSKHKYCLELDVWFTHKLSLGLFSTHFHIFIDFNTKKKKKKHVVIDVDISFLFVCVCYQFFFC